MSEVPDGDVIYAALTSPLTPEQFHVVLLFAFGLRERQIADDLDLTRDRVHQIKRTAVAVIRRTVARELNMVVPR